MDHYFISYSWNDGQVQALRLHDELAGGPDPLPVWLDQRESVRPSMDPWNGQADEAIKACKALILILTQDSASKYSSVGKELARALRYRKPIIPLRFDEQAETPFLLEGIHQVSFSGDFKRGIAELRRHLRWLESPPGRIHVLEFRRESFERELRSQADESQRARILEEIKNLDEQLQTIHQATEHPEETARKRQKSIDEALARERRKESRFESTELVPTVNKPPFSAPKTFLDRTAETRVVGEFLADPAKRLLTVVGRGGVGKTAMVCRVLDSIRQQTLPDDLDTKIDVQGIVYLGSESRREITFENFFHDLCRLLPDERANSLRQFLAASESTRLTMASLTAAISGKPIIVLMDKFDELLDATTDHISDPAVQSVLEGLLDLPQHPVKVVLTSRVSPAGLYLNRPERQVPLPLDKGLPSPFAQELLRALDRDGRVGLLNASNETLEDICHRTLGLPRALELFYSILLNDPYSTLEDVLLDTKHFLHEQVMEKLSAEVFHRLDRSAQQVVEALAVFSRPVVPEAINFLLQPYEPTIDCEPTLKRLVRMYFVRREEGRCFLDAADRKFAKACIPVTPMNERPQTPQCSYSYANLAMRAADYFHQIRTNPDTWESLDDLDPQMSEFDLLLEAGKTDSAMAVLLDIVGQLEVWGHDRQISRMADRVREKLHGSSRVEAAILAGYAFLSLGEYSIAIRRFDEAIQESPEDDLSNILSIRLALGQCCLNQFDYRSASEAFLSVVDNAPDDYAELKVQALIQLGNLAEKQSNFTEAECRYIEGLNLCCSDRGISWNESHEDVELVELPAGLPVENPTAWYLGPAMELEAFDGEEKTGEEHQVQSYPIFLVRFEARDEPDVQIDPDQDRKADDEQGFEDQFEAFPIVADDILADIWLKLAQLYFFKDRLIDAEASCRLAGLIYQEIEDNDGAAEAIDLLSKIAASFSTSDAVALINELKQILGQARETNNRKSELFLLEILGRSYLEFDLIPLAEQTFEGFRELGVDLQMPQVIAAAETELARIAWINGDREGALSKLSKVLKKLGADQPSKRAYVQALLGGIELDLYRPEVATHHFEAAASDYFAANDINGYVDTQKQLASLEIARRNYSAAVARLETTFQIASSLNIPSTTASVLADLAEAYDSAGESALALQKAKEAMDVANEIQLPKVAAQILVTLAGILAELRSFDAARVAYEDARELYREAEYDYGEVSTLTGLANIYYRTGDPVNQVSAARESAELATRLADREQRRQCQMLVAQALVDAGDKKEAIEIFEKALKERPRDALSVGNFGSLLFDAGDYQRSIEQSKHALKLDPTQVFVYRNLGHAHLALGHPEDAEYYYRRAIRERKGGENFHDSIRYIRRLLKQQPGLPRGQEMLELIEQTQQELDDEQSQQDLEQNEQN